MSQKIATITTQILFHLQLSHNSELTLISHFITSLSVGLSNFRCFSAVPAGSVKIIPSRLWLIEISYHVTAKIDNVNGKTRPNPANHFSAQPSAHLLTNRPSVSQLTAVNHLAAVNHCILRPLTPADRQHNACGTADRGGGCTWQVLLQIYIDS